MELFIIYFLNGYKQVAPTELYLYLPLKRFVMLNSFPHPDMQSFLTAKSS